MNNLIGFIGAGNMGGALASAVCRTGYSEKVAVCDKDTKKAKVLAEALSCADADAAFVVENCDTVFLGVKPQHLSSALGEIFDEVKKRRAKPLFVSMAAGVKIEKIKESLGDDTPIIRIMPNTPVSVGEGMILYCASDDVTEEQKANFLEICKCCGRLDEISESAIDAASAVSGCGPAFVYMFIEALADGGVKCGLTREKALLYAEQTLLGAAKLALESGAHPAALKDAVCSPAGSTIEGVRTLENGAFRSSVIEAVSASFERTKALGK